MNKTYLIKFNNQIIGTTHLEKTDASMGVVFGTINPLIENFSYDFIKSFCQKNNIELTFDYLEDKLIGTRTIEQLKVTSPTGIEIKGLGNQIEEMDIEGFEISIQGITHSLFEEEFSHHVKAHSIPK